MEWKEESVGAVSWQNRSQCESHSQLLDCDHQHAEETICEGEQYQCASISDKDLRIDEQKYEREIQTGQSNCALHFGQIGR